MSSERANSTAMEHAVTHALRITAITVIRNGYPNLTIERISPSGWGTRSGPGGDMRKHLVVATKVVPTRSYLLGCNCGVMVVVYRVDG